MRSWAVGSAIFFFVLLVSAGWARAAPAEVIFRIGQSSYEVGSQCYPMDVAPFLERDRTYVPVRYLAEALGVKSSQIQWDGITRTVLFDLNGPELKLKIGVPAIWIDGVRQDLDVAPQIRDGRTMLPARFVAEALGYVVKWEPETQVVSLILPPAAKVLASALNLRSGPGTSYNIQGQVGQGQLLSVLQASSGWYQVRYSGQEGWVAAAYTEPVLQSPPVSRGSDNPPSPSTPSSFEPYRFSQPVRVLLASGVAAAKAVPSEGYALLDATGKVLAVMAPGEVLTFTALSLPVGTGTMAIQVDRDRATLGLYPGPLVLATARGDGYFSLTGGNLYDRKYRGNLRVVLEDKALQIVNELDMEDYLKGVVPREMPASWPLEALKAQAVAARSYAWCKVEKAGKQAAFQLFSDTRDQAYGGMDAECPASNRAVEETRGEVLVCGGKPVAAYFCSSDGGYTERAEDVWRYPCDYLAARPDPYDHTLGNPHYGWQESFTPDQIASCLIQRGYDVTVVEDVYVAARTATGRIKALEVLGKNGAGQTVRPYLANADYVRVVFGLKAPASDLSKTYDPATGRLLQVVFTGNGWGHCLGMSQWGARGMAEKGFGYRSILAFYYPGARLVKLW
ncbi:SpoIID/LytB domain-containing protein [Desulfothermobacter acidiphilus]|uniref:SpoIID/LytB domain-containing protein n=1 Tax=Desulfothermobacter acidiphilus TaxID=1938353 RepID=UPI003F8A563C